MKTTFSTKNNTITSAIKWVILILTPLFLNLLTSCNKDDFGQGEFAVDYYKEGTLETISIADLASTNTLGNYPPIGVIDGKLSVDTRWSSNTLNSILIIDFGEVKTIEHFKIAFGSGQQISYDFEVDYLSTSTKTTNSTVVWLDANNAYSSSGTTSDFETFYFTDEEPITTQFIKIINKGNSLNNNINITEVEFIEYVRNEDKVQNLALFKATDQSTTSSGSPVAAYAVDGNRNGMGLAGSVSQTQNQTEPWWEVYLGNEYAIGNITIWNRTDKCCSNYLENFDVSFYNQADVLTYRTTILGAINTKININGAGSTASRVRIKLRDVGTLSLAEVEVFEAIEGEENNGSTFNDSVDNITIEHLIAKSRGNYEASDIIISDSGIFEDIIN